MSEVTPSIHTTPLRFEAMTLAPREASLICKDGCPFLVSSCEDNSACDANNNPKGGYWHSH